jgi:hypothetical protein
VVNLCRPARAAKPANLAAPFSAGYDQPAYGGGDLCPSCVKLGPAYGASAFEGACGYALAAA